MSSYQIIIRWRYLSLTIILATKPYSTLPFNITVHGTQVQMIIHSSRKCDFHTTCSLKESVAEKDLHSICRNTENQPTMWLKKQKASWLYRLTVSYSSHGLRANCPTWREFPALYLIRLRWILLKAGKLGKALRQKPEGSSGAIILTSLYPEK